MIVYALHCTLCDTSYFKLSDWNEHLVNSLHQTCARKELCQWDKSVRKCCVVIYSRTNLAKNIVNLVIPYLVENIVNGASVLVTDLILSSERPGFGIIRFENREKVDQLFSILKNSSIKIDNHLYQFRRLGKFLKLEWEELLIFSLNLELPNLTTQLEDDPLTRPPTKTADRDDAPNKIFSQVGSLLKQMEIPAEELNFIDNVIKEVTQVLEETIPQKCFVELYRNNYLKLRNNPFDSRYLIIMYIRNKEAHGFTAIDIKTQEQILQQLASTSNNKSVFKQFVIENDSVKSDHTQEAQNNTWVFMSRVNFVHRTSGIRFRLTTFPPSMASLQLSKLVKYYCHFDPRVKPLLSLVHFWAKVNGIQLAKRKVRERDTHSNEVDPVALEWLLLFFLFHKEGALPVPRKILEGPHQPFLFSKTDLGFNQDLEFARKWENERKKGYPPLDSPESPKNLILVFQNFFVFCSEGLGTGRHIINVRDGEILSSEGPSEPFILNGPQERKGIKGKEVFGDHLNILDKKYISSLAELNLSRMIVMTNPFELKWKLCIDNNNWFDVVYPAMEKAAEKIGEFLRNIESSHLTDYSLESVLLCK